MICVPTPLTEHREPDLPYVERTADAVAPHAAAGPARVPGEHHLSRHHARRSSCPILEARGLQGRARTSSSPTRPEREDPGNPDFTTRDDPQGRRRRRPRPAATLAQTLYGQAIERVVPVSDTRSRRGGQDPREHLPRRQHRPGQRAEDGLRPDGHRRLGGHRGGQDQALRLPGRSIPGPGLGGHCIPIDPFYLTWKAREYGDARRASSSWPARSTPPCPRTSSPGWPRR